VVELTHHMKKRKTIVDKINELIRQARMPKYLHRLGPKKYTSRQHAKAWLLKEQHKCSWEDFFDDWAPLYFEKVPEYTTLIKFVKRMPFWLKNKLISLAAGLEPAEYGSIDSTGISRSNASEHYLKRIDRDTQSKLPLKLSMYVSKRRILSFRLRAKLRGDTLDVPYLLRKAKVHAATNCLDKGYDANWIHEEFRQRGLFSIIAVRKNCRRGRYRKEMRDFFDLCQYWQRNPSEYNNSSLKRRFGDFVRSVAFRAQHSEVAARIILHNLKAILLGLFQGSQTIHNLYNAFLNS
jgi:transposase